ncbi:uncharacterized protein LOC115798339 [Archocentrus centrarchus]|uniref:uncharacterized protein LOC115798339 n=1 Tax=Archocentrus centrarchus TaxID=63155 RepID=UPI0011E9E60D|nr:uncharacterized protein LOC115798339 [Archocentrus centrarchus]
MSRTTKMKTASTASNGTSTPVLSNGDDAEWGQTSKNVAGGNQVVLRKKKRCFKERPTHSQEPSTERPLSAVSTSNLTPNFHKRWWSVHYCRCGTSPVIMVSKNTMQPQPPERSVSLPRSLAASHDAVKRYSCPPMRSLTSSGHSSSSSTSSTSSSCSSPSVKTSVITGRDPLGWKLNPKSSSLNSRARAKRLSLQIPLPVIPDLNTPSPKTKPPLKPKPSRRRHSDSAALLQSPRNPLPAVTLDEICAVHLRPRALSDESDDVFSEGKEEEDGVTTHKIPPPVPGKTAMARQIAHLIAYSRLQGCRPDTAASSKDENIYASIMKPKLKYSHHNVTRDGMHATKNAMQQLHISCASERSTPHFPG